MKTSTPIFLLAIFLLLNIFCCDNKDDLKLEVLEILEADLEEKAKSHQDSILVYQSILKMIQDEKYKEIRAELTKDLEYNLAQHIQQDITSTKKSSPQNAKTIKPEPEVKVKAPKMKSPKTKAPKIPSNQQPSTPRSYTTTYKLILHNLECLNQQSGRGQDEIKVIVGNKTILRNYGMKSGDTKNLMNDGAFEIPEDGFITVKVYEEDDLSSDDLLMRFNVDKSQADGQLKEFSKEHSLGLWEYSISYKVLTVRE